MGKASRAKGRRGERELRDLLRSKGFDSVKCGSSLAFGSEPDLMGLPHIHIECKRSEQLRLAEWMAQATADSEKFGDGVPTVFHRRNRAEWMVTMKLGDWVEIYRRAYPANERDD